MVVTATGLELEPIGGIRLGVDGEDVDVGETFAYRGMMLSGVPNLAFSFGYANQSWTLGSDLTATEVCRIVTHMDRYGHTQCTPHTGDAAVAPVQFIDLSSGYIRRAIDRFPKQGSADPVAEGAELHAEPASVQARPGGRSRARVLRARRGRRGLQPYLSAAPASTSPAP